MKNKRILTLTIAALVASSTVTQQLSAFAENPLPVTEYSHVAEQGVDLSGTDSFGSMISEEFSNQQNNENEKEFAVNRIKVTDDYKAIIDLTLAADCKVIVAVYDDSGTELVTSAEQYADDGASTVTVQLDGALIPQYYTLKAYIVSSYSDIALSTVYVDDSHTQKWCDFNKSTTADFPSELVYDLDGDTTNNFVVFNRNVVRVAGNADANTLDLVSFNSDGLIEYTFSNCTGDLLNLNSGDLLSYMDENNWILFKVEYTYEGNPLKVVGRKASVEDFFSFVKLNLDMEDFINSTLEYNEPDNSPRLLSDETEASDTYYADAEPSDGELMSTVEHNFASSAPSDLSEVKKIEIHGACALSQEGTDIDDAEMAYGGYLAINDTKLPYFGAKINSDGFQYIAQSEVIEGLEAEIALGDKSDASLTFDNGLQATWDQEDLLQIEYQPDENGPKLEVNVKDMLDFLEDKEDDGDDGGPEFGFAASADIIFDNILFSFNYSDAAGKKLELGYDYSVTLDIKADVSYSKEIPLGTAVMGFHGILLQIKFKLDLEGEVNFEDEMTENGSFYALFSSANAMPIINATGPYFNNQATAEGEGSITFTTEGSASIVNTLLKVKLSLAEKLTISVTKGGTNNGQPFAMHRCRDCSSGKIKLKFTFGYEVSAGFGLLTLSQDFTLSDVTIAQFHICYDCSEGQATHPHKGMIEPGQCPCIGSSQVIIYPFFDDKEEDNKYLYDYADVPSDYYKDLNADIYIMNRATGKLELDHEKMRYGVISLDSADPALFGNVNAFYIDAIPDTEYAVDVHYGSYNSELLYFNVDEKLRVFYEDKILSSSHNNISFFTTNDGVEEVKSGVFYIPAALSKGISKTGNVVNYYNEKALGFGTVTITYVPGAQAEGDIKDALGTDAIKTITAQVNEDGTFSFVFPPDDRGTKCWYMSYYGKSSDPTGWLPDVRYTAFNTLYKDDMALTIKACGDQKTVLRFVDDSGNPLTNEILSYIDLTLTDSHNLPSFSGHIITDQNGEYEVQLPYDTYYIEAEFFQREGNGYYIDKTVTQRDDSLRPRSGKLSVNLSGSTATVCASQAKSNVEVIVTDSLGNPLSNMNLYGDRLNIAKVSTDENGRATLRLPGGLNYIAVDKYGYHGVAAVMVDGDLTGDNAIRLIAYERSLGVKKITISIRTEDGQPASGAVVNLDCFDIPLTADDNGEVSVMVPIKLYELTAEYNGRAESWHFKPDSDYIEFRFGKAVDDNEFVNVFKYKNYYWAITSKGRVYEFSTIIDYNSSYPIYLNLDGKTAKAIDSCCQQTAFLTDDGYVFLRNNQDGEVPSLLDMGGKKVISISLADEAAAKPFNSDLYSQMIMLTEDGELYLLGCDYGGNTFGGGEMNYSTPQRIDIPEKIIKYYSAHNDRGRVQNLAISEDGSLYIWGNGLGQKPMELSVDDKPVDSILKVTDTYYMAKTRDGALYEWTSIKRESDKFVYANNQEPVSLLDNVNEYSSYFGTHIATTADGKLYVWGKTDYDQAQNGKDSNPKPVEVNISGESFSNPAVSGIVGSGIMIFADSGNLYSWGYHNNKVIRKPALVDTDVVYAFYNAGYEYYLKSNGDFYMWKPVSSDGTPERVDYAEPAEKRNADGKIVRVFDQNTALTEDGRLFIWNGQDDPVEIYTDSTHYVDVTVTDINGDPIPGVEVTSYRQKCVTGSNGKVRLTSPHEIAYITANYQGIAVKKNVDLRYTDRIDDDGIKLTFKFDITQPDSIENASYKKIYACPKGVLLISENGVVSVMDWDRGTTYTIDTPEPIISADVGNSYILNPIILLSESGKVYYGSLTPRICLADIPEPVTYVKMDGSKYTAITESGKFYSWSNSENDKPELFAQINGTIKSLSCSDGSYNAIGSNDVLYSWGAGMLGRDKSVCSAAIPGPVDLGNVVKSEITNNSGAALTADGDLYLWGKEYTNYYPLASGNSTVELPEKAVLPEKIKDVSEYCNFALSESGKLYAWGSILYNAYPVSGSQEKQEHYCVIDIGEPVVKFCHNYDNAVAITESGKVYAWGRKGMLGTPDQGSDAYTPVLVDIDGKIATDVSISSNTVAVLMSDGSAYYWNDRSNPTPTQIITYDIELERSGAVENMLYRSNVKYILSKYYSGLDNGIYNFYVRSPKDNSIIYINQYNVTNGNISAGFKSSFKTPNCYIRKLSSTDIENAEITIPSALYTGIGICDPDVVLNGVTLTPGRDYMLLGDVMTSEPNVYEALVTGTGDYYGTKKFSWQITPPAPTDHISISSVPPKTVYAIGDVLDTSGGKITVSCTDGSSYFISMTPNMVTGFDSSKLGKQTLTVTYDGETDEFEITVVEQPADVVLADIRLTKLPSKTTYNVGEMLDLSGGVLIAVYSDGTSQEIEITLDMIIGFDSSKPGNQTLTVTYNGKTTTFTVKVRSSSSGDSSGGGSSGGGSSGGGSSGGGSYGGGGRTPSTSDNSENKISAALEYRNIGRAIQPGTLEKVFVNNQYFFKIIFESHAIGCWANLMNQNGDKLEFVSAAQIQTDGSVLLPFGEAEKYMVIIDRYTYLTGDANDDLIVNALDASAILRHIVGNAPLTENQLSALDCNGDGAVNALDASWILKKAVGLIA